MSGAHQRPVELARKILTEGIPFGPRTNPCACGAGQYAHAGAHGTGGCKATGCRRYRADLAYQLAYAAHDAQNTELGASLRAADRMEREEHYKANPRVPGQWSIGASDTSTCPRKIQYRNKPPEDFVPAPEDKREALAGTMLHKQITAKMRRLYPWRIFAGKVRIAGLDRESEFDSYDPITCEVEDYKTAGDWRWDVLGNHGPEVTVWEQAMLYALALEDDGYEVKTVRLSYYKRCNGHTETFVRDYDRSIAEAARDRLMGHATSLDLGIDLPKTGTGPTNDALCRRCFARWHCWNVPAAERVGRSPESFTVLGEDPADDDIIWAIANKVEKAEIRLAAEKAENEAKTLLDGIEPRRYGDYRGYEVAGGPDGPDHAADAAQLRELLPLPDGMRPDPDAVPVPTKRRKPHIRWGRVRKADLDKERKARERAARAAETGGEVA